MRRAVLVAVVMGLGMSLSTSATALWTATTAPGGTGATTAATLAAGNQPTVTSAQPNTVSVSWPATTDPVPASGYEIRAYDASTGSSRTVAGTCAGVVPTTSCQDTGVPAGSWRYAIVPRQQAWSGAEGPRSDVVTVSDPVAPSSLVLFDASGQVTPTTDEVRIQFDGPLDVSSICSTWSGGGDQQLTGRDVIVTITNSGSNDVVTVTDSRCDLNVGSIATGRDYVTTTSTFREPLLLGSDSRVLWTAATNTLTIHLGTQVSGLLSLVAQSPATVTYTPDPDLRDPSGHPIDTTPFTAADQRF